MDGPVTEPFLSREALLEPLLADRRLWRGHRIADAASGIPSGHALLDAALPDGGFPAAALTEIFVPSVEPIATAMPGLGELALVLPALAGHRHRARWAVAGVEPALPILDAPHFNEGLPLLGKPSEGEDLVADYASTGLTLGRHPLALLRERLRRLGARTAAELRTLPDGTPARVAGIVINRQRPGTASGVTFMTLEDETGHANVIIWRDIAERQRSVLLGSRLMLVAGVLQREGEVVHLIARRLFDQTRLLGRLTTRSRDFH